MNDKGPLKPLCVDCDGTLIKTDLLHESLVGLAKKSLFALLLVPIWLFSGKAYLKEQLSRRVDIDPSSLPYNEALLDYIEVARGEGRSVVLATASPRKYADAIADHLGFFDAVLATECGKNMSGNCKADQLDEMFGETGYIYAGNSLPDLKVWSRSDQAVVVDASPALQGKIAQVTNIARVFNSNQAKPLDYINAIRAHQWVKNLLVFVPLLAAHRVTEINLAWDAVVAFLAFSVCASSVYLINDLLDLPMDRLHPTKKKRALASGRIPITHAIWLILLLLIISIAVASTLNMAFWIVLGGYFVATLGYSLWLKSKVFFDVLMLAGLYTSRVIAGAAAVSITPSFWLLAFSLFLFLSLALVKRYAELLVLLENEKTTSAGRGYHVEDLPILANMGVSSGYLAVLVFALYVNSPSVSGMYSQPQLLWLAIPPLLFWVSRIWMKTHRGEMHEDPVVYAARDPVSVATGLVAGGVIAAATIL